MNKDRMLAVILFVSLLMIVVFEFILRIQLSSISLQSDLALVYLDRIGWLQLIETVLTLGLLGTLTFMGIDWKE